MISGNYRSGRRPKPAWKKQLTGRPVRDETSPVAPVGDVVKPAGLSVGASQVWEELAPHALALGTLTVADVRAFALLCELTATAVLASSEKGRVAGSTRLERQTAGALKPYLELFGLAGPVSRLRLHLPPPAAAANPLNKFLDRAKSKWAGLK